LNTERENTLKSKFQDIRRVAEENSIYIQFNPEQVEMKDTLHQDLLNYNFFTILLRTKNRPNPASYTDLIKCLINNSQSYAIQILKEFSRKETILEFLIECPINEVKKVICGVLYCAMLKLGENEVVSSFILILIEFSILNYSLIEKSIYTIYFLIYRFCLLGDWSKEFMIKKDFYAFFDSLLSEVEYYQGQLEELALKCKLDFSGIERPEKSMLTLGLLEVEKLTAMEDAKEKKYHEAYQGDAYSYIFMIHITIFAYTYNRQMYYSKDKIVVLDFKSSSFLEYYIMKAKSLQCTYELGALIASKCKNKEEESQVFESVLIKLFMALDYQDMDNLFKLFKIYY
jgi:hypothetical protein